MKISYKEALFNPNVSWSELAEGVIIPDKLYKYQSFYFENGEENQFWKKSLSGEFHLSLGCEFEDVNDCRPYINEEDVKQHLYNFLISMDVEQLRINSAINQFEEQFNENVIADIVKKYQSEIRIGCFTDSFQNQKMWGKYSNDSRGFCIEYNTKNSELFSLSTLPILYTSEQYNMSFNLANSIILEWCRLGKKRSEEESLQIYGEIYKKIFKTAYIPIFLKDATKWSFEREYRMFILKNRNTTKGMLRTKEVLDENYNIDLSKAINAIYLGADFDKNKNADKLYETILEIRNNRQDNFFGIYKLNEYGIAQKLC